LHNLQELSHPSFRLLHIQLRNYKGFDATASAFPPDVHAMVRYLAFQLVVRVKQAHLGKSEDAKKVNFTNTSFMAAIQLPTDDENNLHASITPQLLATPSLLWLTIKSNNGREEPIIGTYMVAPR
jgi:hypothetical protein